VDMTSEVKQDAGSSGIDGQHTSNNIVQKVWHILKAIMHQVYRKVSK